MRASFHTLEEPKLRFSAAPITPVNSTFLPLGSFLLNLVSCLVFQHTDISKPVLSKHNYSQFFYLFLNLSNTQYHTHTHVMLLFVFMFNFPRNSFQFHCFFDLGGITRSYLTFHFQLSFVCAFTNSQELSYIYNFILI